MTLQKNKPKKKETMLDFIKANQTEKSPLAKQESAAQANIHAYKYTDEYAKELADYNSNLTDLNPLYTAIQPLHEVLVRFYLYEPLRVGELVMPYKEMLPVATNSGVGKSQSIETDFPFSNKAVVISAPESNPLKAGDVIMCSHRATQLLVLGQGANAEIKIEQSFVHPDSNLHKTPADPKNPHYGYALIQYHLIQAKL